MTGRTLTPVTVGNGAEVPRKGLSTLPDPLTSFGTGVSSVSPNGLSIQEVTDGDRGPEPEGRDEAGGPVQGEGAHGSVLI